jgi:VWFA-related protein
VITRGRLNLLIIFLLPLLVEARTAGVQAGVVAQKDRTAASASEPQGPAQSSRAPDEPEGLIHLDVVVTDQTGKTLSGLKATDFSVLDNGQPEKILSFEAYDGAGVRPGPPGAITLVLDLLPPAKRGERSVGQFPEDLAQFERNQVDTFLRQNGGHLAQPISILILTINGLSQVGPSADGNALAESIAHDRGTPLIRTDRAANIDQTWNASQAPYMGALSSNASVGVNPPAEAALKALGVIATAERRQPGRKLLIWVGPGWGIASGNNPEELVGKKQKQALFDRVVWFSTLLRLARLNLYSFSVGETNDQSAMEIGPPGTMPPLRGPGPPNVPPAVTSPEQADVLDLNRKVLAMESGGRVLEPAYDLTKQLNDCVREGSAFYTLSFNPGPAQHPDEYHTLKVDVRQPGLTARSDTFYYDQPYFLDTPNPAIRKVTVAQLDQLLGAARGESDGDMARQLSALELTERPSSAKIASWTAELHGKKARSLLVALADASAFLDPPPEDILTDAPPDKNLQQQMISLVEDYLNQTIPHLPNFFAQRTAVRYEETPAYYEGNATFTAAEPLHVVDNSKTMVLYRDGAEMESKAPQRGNEDRYLTTYGTFGPVLGAVKCALANSVIWSRWEKDASGGRGAVFRFAVPMALSRYKVGGCCLPEGGGTIPFVRMTGYHGEIAIDPASGAVFRVEVEADLNEFVPLDRDDVMVAYGPVEIGGKTYICPVRSVGIWRARSVNTLVEWNTLSFLAWAPYATKLNDFRYDNYHKFQAKSRMLPGFTSTPE